VAGNLSYLIGLGSMEFETGNTSSSKLKFFDHHSLDNPNLLILIKLHLSYEYFH
jgi:hypothetical protein